MVGFLRPGNMLLLSQGRVCPDNCTCCHTETEVADQTFFSLIQSQYTDTGPTSPSADPITPGAWQSSHWSTNFEVTGMTRPSERSTASTAIEPRSGALEADTLTTRPKWRSLLLPERWPCIQRSGDGVSVSFESWRSCIAPGYPW